MASAAAAAAAGATPPEAMATEPAGIAPEEDPPPSSLFLFFFSPRVTRVQPSPEAARAAAAAASSASLSKSSTHRSSLAASAAFPGRKSLLWDSTHSLSPCGGAFVVSPSSPFDVFFLLLSALFVAVEERGGRCSVAAERAAAALARVCSAFGEENETMAEHWLWFGGEERVEEVERRRGERRRRFFRHQ